MAENPTRTRIIRVFRYDPEKGGEGHFDRYELQIPDQRLTTVLDLLIRIQKEQDPTLAFRYACRVSMCGSCAMVIDGRERLACKTIVGDLKGNEITVRPLNHFPIIKDLVVDMEPFFAKYEEAMPFFEPRAEGGCEAGAGGCSCKEISSEPAVIRPDSKERQAIGLATECIACGCCVSSCSMVHYHSGYLGPAALNRAFTLLADSRDALHDERMIQALESCYNCRLEFNCTEVCPKEISPTRAIKFIHRWALKEGFRKRIEPPAEEKPRQAAAISSGIVDASRRRFLKGITYTLGTATFLALGGVLAASAVLPSLRPSTRQWVRVGKMDDFRPGKIYTAHLSYDGQDAFYRTRTVKPVLIDRPPDVDKLVVFNSRCTHLGCTVRWDEAKKLFLCACHGGAFDREGVVKAGPPPRPLERLDFKVESGNLFVEVA